MKDNKYYMDPVMFTSAGKLGVIGADGTCEKYFDFDITGQASWGAGPAFGDGRRIILASYEDTTISKAVAGEVKSHAWIYDLTDGSIKEILDKDRTAKYIGCCGIIDDNKIVWTELADGENRLFISDLEGNGKYELTSGDEGFIYGVHLSPDRERISFHITGSKKAENNRKNAFRTGPYAINTIKTDGTVRTLVADCAGHIYFDPVWSPDGQWLAYVDCFEEEDKAHFAADLCIGRPDGSEHRVVTHGQRNWFGTSYGSKNNRGGGSNTTRWSPDGRTLLYTRIASGSHADCSYDPHLPDHEELVYMPGMARGGTQICTADPFTGNIIELTDLQEGKWEHHAGYTQDGSEIFYRRSIVGYDSELWIMKNDGSDRRLLTRGYGNKGAWGYAYTGNQLKIRKDC
jgi:hypothetical protein